MTGERGRRRGGGGAYTSRRIKQIARIRRADRMAKADCERKERLSEGDIKQTSKFKSDNKEKDRRGVGGGDTGQAKPASDDATQRNGEE